MISSDNPYSKMQKAHYEGIAPHWGPYLHHNDNPDYWAILLAPLGSGDWAGKYALDFGSGQGRNIVNMLKMSNIERADGCDISPSNNMIVKEKLKNHSGRFELFDVNGIELNGVPSGTYDFVMSTVVLQHICVHSIRMSIMKDIFRVLKDGGIFNFQMGYGGKPGWKTTGYYDDLLEASDTNGALDVSISDPKPLLDDLASIGFKDVTFQIRPPWDDDHVNWIYVKAVK